MKNRLGLIAIGAISILGLLMWNWVAQLPLHESHAHGDEIVENHMHTHIGPFSHDHTHFGIQDGTTHSHPHVHRHEHDLSPEMEELLNQGWQQIGHHHDDAGLVCVYLGKCVRHQTVFNIEFTKICGGKSAVVPNHSRFSAEFFVGVKSIGSLLFSKDGDTFSATTSDTKFEHPTLSVRCEGLEIEGAQMEFVLAIHTNLDSSESPNVESEVNDQRK